MGNKEVYVIEDKEAGTLRYSTWWKPGGGMMYNRDCLGHKHPEQTYNFLKRHGVTPEDYGIKHPLVEIKEKEFLTKTRDELIAEILTLREQLEAAYAAGF